LDAVEAARAANVAAARVSPETLRENEWEQTARVKAWVASTESMKASSNEMPGHTASTFEWNSPGDNRPVVVLFCAPECHRSVELKGTLNTLAPEYQGRVNFLSLNIKKEIRLAERFQVHSTPSLLVLLDGVVLYHVIGMLPERELRSMFEAAQRSSAASTPLIKPGGRFKA